MTGKNMEHYGHFKTTHYRMQFRRYIYNEELSLSEGICVLYVRNYRNCKFQEYQIYFPHRDHIYDFDLYSIKKETIPLDHKIIENNYPYIVHKIREEYEKFGVVIKFRNKRPKIRESKLVYTRFLNLKQLRSSSPVIFNGCDKNN